MGLRDRFRPRASATNGSELRSSGGTPSDSGDPFEIFAYWVPNNSLEKQIRSQAKAAGRNDIPVVENHIITDPPGIGFVLALTQEAMLNLSSEANRILKPRSLEIASLLQSLKAPPTSFSPNIERSRSIHADKLTKLRTLEMEVLQLERALRSRLNKAQAHGNRLVEAYVIVLTSHHSHPSILQRRWRPPQVQDPEEFMDFGQHLVRAEIAEFEAEYDELFVPADDPDRAPAPDPELDPEASSDS